MTSSKLPPPIDITLLKDKTPEDMVEYIYQNYFKYDFMSRQSREKLFGRFIYLDLDFLDYRPERFWHIISFEPSKSKYTVDPCTNANDLLLCRRIKQKCDKRLCIPVDGRLKNRCECMYRIRRINWINPILKLANQKDESIKIWFKDEKDDKNKTVRKAYIRFQDELADYLILLIDDSINGNMTYKFVTAYPVVHNRTKERLDQSFECCKNAYQKQKAGLSYAESGSLLLQHGR